MKVIPIVDVFAGPGGLSEGFTRCASQSSSFKVVLSIEKDAIAYQTLLLRTFYRQFDRVPADYYRYIRSEISKMELFSKFPKELAIAKDEVWNTELGFEPRESLHNRLRAVIGQSKTWILIGGPPCQAYSMVGRSRMLGKLRENLSKKVKQDIRDKIAVSLKGESEESLKSAINEAEAQAAERKFREDHRHTLYKEYLEIVGVHQPSVFVMENVKGLLSSKLKNGRTLDYILEDLRDPWGALNAIDYLAANRPNHTHKYRLHSFRVKRSEDTLLDGKDFVLNSEDFGVPQRRHRLFILGVRDDITTSPNILRKSTRKVSIQDVIGNMPVLRSHISRRNDSQSEWESAVRDSVDQLFNSIDDQPLENRIQEVAKNLSTATSVGDKFIPCNARLKGNIGEFINDQRIKGVVQHRARGHMLSDLTRYLFCACYADVYGTAPTLYDFPTRLLPAHRNTKELDESGRSKGNKVIFEDRFRVQIKTEPATTITSHISKDGHYYIHFDPKQCRSLTCREAARIQTFPDNYFFEGNRTQQYEQVGNAVPPLLAQKLALIVMKLLEAST